MRIVILGGGFLGQLLHTLVPQAEVLDWGKPGGPSSRALGPQYLWEPIGSLPVQEFLVHTTVNGLTPTLPAIEAYKRKVGKEHDNGDWKAQFQPVMRGYSVTLPTPRITYETTVQQIDPEESTLVTTRGRTIAYDLLLSTIPLPAFLDMLSPAEAGGHPELVSRPIYVSAESVPAILHTASRDVHVNYMAYDCTSIYRQTRRDNQIHHESLEPLPGVTTRRLLPGKIYAHPDVPGLRNELAKAGLLMFGRYARWESDELAHETYRNASRTLRAMGVLA